MINLFDSNNIDQLDWPKTEEGQFAKKFLTPLVKEGTASYFTNIETKMMVLQIEDFVLPITINDSVLDNSYVCSCYSYYIGYGIISANKIKNKFLQSSVKQVIKGLGKILKLGHIDKIVSVNNWLFSTNHYPKLEKKQILSIRKFIQETFPGHAIVFRSINTLDENCPMNPLTEAGFKLIASRQIFLLNAKDAKIFEARLFKSDLKLLNKTDYQIDDLKNPYEANRILSLYNALYVDKYSKLNPQPTEKFIELLITNQIFNFKTLKKNDQIHGVVGYYSAFGVMSSPFFGYDTSLPQERGLYRLLSTILTTVAKNKKQLFNQSSGASFYKSVRKATPTIEYSAVYTAHLPFKTRCTWQMLKLVVNHFGILWMKNY